MAKPGGSMLKWTGTKGNDTEIVGSTDALAHTSYDAGAGYDTLDLSHLSAGVSLNVILGSPGGASSNVWPDSPFVGSWWNFNSDHLSAATRVDGTINNFEKIVGTSFNDYLELRGGSVARVVDGGSGDDAIWVSGSGGTSTAIGGLDSDQLFGGGHSGDIFVGGTYVNGVATPDGVSDSFDLTAGTVLDFEVGIDKLYLDVTPASVLGEQWTDGTTAYGAGASLATSNGAVTLVGVSASEMNSIPLGFDLSESNGVLTSGHGDDFIVGTPQVGSASFIFPDGSGNDEMVGFQASLDTLVFPDETSVTWSQTSYHGEPALVATYDSGHSSLTLIGLTMADVAHVPVLFGGSA